jgi:hypothetical protein
VNQPRISEKVCDRGFAGVLDDESVLEDLGERSAALVLPDGISLRAAELRSWF